MDLVAFFNSMTMEIAKCAEWPFFLLNFFPCRVGNVSFIFVVIISSHRGHALVVSSPLEFVEN